MSPRASVTTTSRSTQTCRGRGGQRDLDSRGRCRRRGPLVPLLLTARTADVEACPQSVDYGQILNFEVVDFETPSKW